MAIPNIDLLTPRTVIRYSFGKRISENSYPTPFNHIRANEIFNQARNQTKHGPWSDQLDKVMSPGERAYIMAIWDTMPGNTCFVDAFLRVKNQTL